MFAESASLKALYPKSVGDQDFGRGEAMEEESTRVDRGTRYWCSSLKVAMTLMTLFFVLASVAQVSLSVGRCTTWVHG